MMATRKTLVEAKSQQRPDERWLVTGAPSKGIERLKIWVSLTAALVFMRTAFALLDCRAFRASLFLGSWSSSFSHCSVVETETVD